MSSNLWRDLLATQTSWIYPQIVCIGSSLWYSTAYNAGEEGMVEYSIKFNKILQIVKYPSSIQPDYHSLCRHYNNIYIVDGFAGSITLFNTLTLQFASTTRIPKIGYNAVCMVFDDKIYIFNGHTNSKDIVIYSPKENNFELAAVMKSHLGSVCILRYNDQIIRFGGFNYDTNQCMDKFIMSSPIKNLKTKKNNHSDIHWFEKLTCKLPEPINGCGYILYKDYVITFGGSTHGGKKLDSMYLLDLKNTNNGWIQLTHIKCPVKSKFIAVLDENTNNIHLFARVDNKKHFSIPINSVLNTKINVYYKNENENENENKNNISNNNNNDNDNDNYMLKQEI
eukprot:128514_1